MKYTIVIKTKFGGVKWGYSTFKEAYDQARSWIRNNPQCTLITGEIHIANSPIWYFFDEYGMSRISDYRFNNLVLLRPIKKGA